jgi:hypothetical protein
VGAVALVGAGCATSGAELATRMAVPNQAVLMLQEDQFVHANWGLLKDLQTSDWRESSPAFTPIFHEIVDAFRDRFGSERVRLFQGNEGPRNIDTWGTQVFPDSAVGLLVAGLRIRADYSTTTSDELVLTLTSQLALADVRKNTFLGENTYTRPMGNVPVTLGQVRSDPFPPPRELTQDGVMEVFPPGRLADALADSTRVGLSTFLSDEGG